ncbi:hypothetical protein L218DRAFT_991690 [Marasmius fiardii PR-910]|nr:hypothetical protein L218DRAFT_991690 [Marasmius fiardii PR-910]
MANIERLPPETITQILKVASQLDDKLSLPSTLLICAKVSQRWRSLVHQIFQTPDVSTNIVIPFNELRERNFSIRKWTTFWLERSGNYSISITFRLHPQHLGGSGQDVEIFHDLLTHHIIPHISRTRRWQLICPESGLAHSTSSLLSRLTEIDAPTLEEIVIRIASTEARMIVSTSSPVPLFKSTPNLRRLTIHGSNMLHPLSEGITEIDLRPIALSDITFRQLVLTCPRVEVLSLRAIHVSGGWYPGLPSGSVLADPTWIEMPSLRSLTLEFLISSVYANLYRQVLTTVLAPNLKYMEVSLEGSDVNLMNVLPNPAALTKLRKIKLMGVSKLVSRTFLLGTVGIVTGEMDSSTWFRGFPADSSVEEIHLSHSSGEVLGIVFPVSELPVDPSKRSSAFLPLFDSRSSSSPSGPFSNLKCIAVETSKVEELVWLCRLISVKQTIRTVWLSGSALEMLCTSLVLLEDEEVPGRLGIGMIQEPGRAPCPAASVEERRDDCVLKWMKNRAAVKVLEKC